MWAASQDILYTLKAAVGTVAVGTVAIPGVEELSIVTAERPPTIYSIYLRFTFVALIFRSGVETFAGPRKHDLSFHYNFCSSKSTGRKNICIS